MPAQRPISVRLRPQPSHNPLKGSMMHTCTQGEGKEAGEDQVSEEGRGGVVMII